MKSIYCWANEKRVYVQVRDSFVQDNGREDFFGGGDNASPHISLIKDDHRIGSIGCTKRMHAGGRRRRPIIKIAFAVASIFEGTFRDT